MGHNVVSAIKTSSVTLQDLAARARGKYCKFAIFNKTVVSMTDMSRTRKDMTHGVISIDSILLNSMRNGKKCEFSWAKNGHN